MNSNFLKMPDRIFGISSSLIRLFLLPLGAILFFLISLRMIIIPKIDSIKSLQGLVTKVKSEIKTTNEKRAYLASIDQDELLRNEEYLSSAVLQAKNSYMLVGVIRNVVDGFDYRVRSFSISPIELKDGEESLKVSDKNVATKLPINVELEGPKDKMVDLLISIENSLPIMFIDKISVSSKQEVSMIDLSISSYYVPNNPDLVSGNLSLKDLMPTKEESELLSKISQFNKDSELIQSLSDQGTEGKSYIEYPRDNPFSL
jgi:hypothetical protein